MLFRTKIVKGESRKKEVYLFFYAELHPSLSKESERREQKKRSLLIFFMQSCILAYPKRVKSLDYLKDIAIRRYIAMQATHDLWNNYFVLP
jgi:hypothetical protein